MLRLCSCVHVESMFPKNLDELQARVQELPGKVMTTVSDAKEKCSLQQQLERRLYLLYIPTLYALYLLYTSRSLLVYLFCSRKLYTNQRWQAQSQEVQLSQRNRAHCLLLLARYAMAVDVNPLSVVGLLVISRKRSQIDPQLDLLWNTVRRLASLILLPHSDLLPDARWRDILVLNKNYVQILIRPCVQFGVRPQLL